MLTPGFPGWPVKRIERLFQRLGVEYEIVLVDVPERIRHFDENPCYVCSRERRKRLFELARTRGIRKIALAHHLEDVNETYLLNLLYSASARTFVPRQEFFGGKVEFIRPLYAFDKPAVMKYLRSRGIEGSPHALSVRGSWPPRGDAPLPEPSLSALSPHPPEPVLGHSEHQGRIPALSREAPLRSTNLMQSDFDLTSAANSVMFTHAD